MCSRIKRSWVVGHGDDRHTLDANHEVVYEGNRIVYVGPRFDGSVDVELDGAGRSSFCWFDPRHKRAPSNQPASEA